MVEIIDTKKIQMPKQVISRNFLNDGLVRVFSSFLERVVLEIPQGMEVYESRFKSPIKTGCDENDFGRFRHYVANSDCAVIVLPQRGGGYNGAQLVASYLASRGIDAYEIETPMRGQRLPKGLRSMCELDMDLDMLKMVFRQAIVEIGEISEVIQQERKGIFGISLGAIYASILYGTKKNLESACLLMGGGGLARMVFESQDRLAKYLKMHLEEWEIGLEEAKKIFEDIEPCNYVDPKKAGNLLMISAKSDKDVPFEYSKELRRAWGACEEVVLNADHLGIVKEVGGLLPKILKHFKKTLQDGRN